MECGIVITGMYLMVMLTGSSVNAESTWQAEPNEHSQSMDHRDSLQHAA